MALAKRLGRVLPRRDSAAGSENGDQLKVVGVRTARRYLDQLVAGLETERVRRRMYKAPLPRGVPAPSLARLLADWTRGDSAVIVRLRDRQPKRIAFIARNSRTRISVRLVAGGIDRGDTLHAALRQLGFRETISTIRSAALARRLVQQGHIRLEDSDQYLNRF